MRAMSGSASRSGAKRAALVSSRPNSQPMWACQKPLASAAAEVPYSQGECGSPSLSAKAWWRRWSATQVMIEAWNAMAAGDREPDPQRPVGLERAVGEVAVEPDRHAEPDRK